MISPWLIQIGIALALCVGAFIAGVNVESNHRDAQLLAAERAAAESYRAAVAHQRSQAAEIAQQLSAERRSRESDSASFREQLAKARRNGVALATCPGSETKERVVLVSPPTEQKPEARGVGEPRFTAEFGRLHDAAVSVGMPGASDSGGVDGPASASITFTAEEVLSVIAENGAKCSELRSQVIGFQNFVRNQGWWK